MFLNQGTYGEVRILSRPSVVAMTRNQIPGVRSVYGDEAFREGSYGFGWSVVHDLGSCLAYSEPLQSPKLFSHGGAGGVFLWVDPAHEILGTYFSVFSRKGLPKGRSLLELYYLRGRTDLFINAVTAAVTDVKLSNETYKGI